VSTLKRILPSRARRLPTRALTGLVAGLLSMLVAGCAAPTPDAELETALQAAREAARDSTRGEEAIALLQAFVKGHPQSPGAPEALRQLGMLRQQQGEVEAAVAEYERILASYPASDIADQAQFMIAFIKEDFLGDFDGARAAYQALIDNYPDSELVAQAQTLRDNVGRDPDDYIRFQEDAE
jgi:outer membrane protein assembly factor BamD (BamD/ComL family)